MCVNNSFAICSFSLSLVRETVQREEKRNKEVKRWRQREKREREETEREERERERKKNKVETESGQRKKKKMKVDFDHNFTHQAFFSPFVFSVFSPPSLHTASP